MKRLRHIAEYVLAIAVIWCLRCFSIQTASNICGKIFSSLGPLHSSTATAKKNLHQAFPKLSKQKEQEIIRKMWENLGRNFAELLFFKNLSDRELNKIVTIKITANLRKLLDSKRPIIGVFGHFGNWELFGRVLSREFPTRSTAFVYRTPSNKFTAKLIKDLRDIPRIIPVPKGFDALKGLVGAINNSDLIFLAVDQRLDNGMDVSFFGKTAPTSYIPAKLATHYKCPIIFARIIRGKGVNFIAEFSGPMDIDSKTSDRDITQRINSVYEKWATEYVAQWFWVHKRYKKDFYDNNS